MAAGTDQTDSCAFEVVLETSAERLELGLRQVPQQRLQRWRVDVEFLRGNRWVQRPRESLSQGVERDQATSRLCIDGGLLLHGRPVRERAALGVHEFMCERATLFDPA